MPTGSGLPRVGTGRTGQTGLTGQNRNSSVALERRHLTLEMTMLNDPAVDSQMNLRSSATELFRF